MIVVDRTLGLAFPPERGGRWPRGGSARPGPSADASRVSHGMGPPAGSPRLDPGRSAAAPDLIPGYRVTRRKGIHQATVEVAVSSVGLGVGGQPFAVRRRPALTCIAGRVRPA